MDAISPSRPAASLRLYGRRDCHLCDEMLRALMPWQSRLGFTVHRVDIDLEPALEGLYGHKVPVLTEGPYEICHHFLDEDALRAYLGTER